MSVFGRGLALAATSMVAVAALIHVSVRPALAQAECAGAEALANAELYEEALAAYVNCSRQIRPPHARS